ncbi:MAG: SDR family NAD(P)-dependent oxidoreductase [Hyphomicrobiaceae bacterium]
MQQLPNFQLNDRTALVTGAGRGLGVGIAHGLAQAGADVVLVARTAAEIEAVAADINAAGGRARPIVLDVTDDAAVARTFADLPALDILVNNAGTNIPREFVEFESAALDKLLQLNVRAAFLVAQAAVQRMLADGERADRGGAVVNITSQLGRVAMRGRSVYTMTKHAVEGLTKAMAIELAEKNIRVNSVGPTWIDTPMTRPALADPVLRKDVIDSIPMGHLAQVEDVVGAVVFLSSPAAGMITGASLVVDGGWTAR